VTRRPSAWLVIRALYELARHDILAAWSGPQRVGQQLRQEPRAAKTDALLIDTICEAVQLAACFYWKPVPCLQRSLCCARLLRSCGVAARLVIGYRPVPFFCHAWVEVDGRVVNDSPTYQQRLSVLYTA
jgi:hypothetical protein